MLVHLAVWLLVQMRACHVPMCIAAGANFVAIYSSTPAINLHIPHEV